MHRHHPICRDAGFTLVELVIVILILGILSAVALPRFLDLGADARRAKADAILGAVRSANHIVRAGALVQGSANALAGTVVLDGQNIDTSYGYATTDGIIAAAGIEAGADNLTLVPGSDSSISFWIDGASNPATCSVKYRQALAPNDSPEITVATAGCG